MREYTDLYFVVANACVPLKRDFSCSKGMLCGVLYGESVVFSCSREAIVLMMI
jgi:hypothetical protein